MAKRPKPANYVPEKDLQQRIKQVARQLGWKLHHETYSLGTPPGYPDLTLVHPRHGVLWLELKASNGVVKPSQQEWIDRLTEAGQRAYIVFPQHEDLVLEMLQGRDVEFPVSDQLELWEQAS